MRRIVLCLAFVAFAGSAIADEPPQPRAHEEQIFTGSAAVQALGEATYSVLVAPTMTQPKLVGRLTASGGTGNDIAVSLLSESDVQNLKNGHATSVYSTGQVTIANLDVPMLAAGSYVLVLSNRFSALTPKTVTGSVTLKWIEAPPAAEVAAWKDKENRTFTNNMLRLVGLSVLLGGLVVWLTMHSIASRKRQGGEGTEERRAA